LIKRNKVYNFSLLLRNCQILSVFFRVPVVILQIHFGSGAIRIGMIFPGSVSRSDPVKVSDPIGSGSTTLLGSPNSDAPEESPE
jgi:hypothetical protein